MATRLQDKKADLLERVADRLHDKLADRQAELAEAVRAPLLPGGVAGRPARARPADLYGAALSHLRLGEHRPPGQAKVRVYNPQIEQHGWQSTHTVVEVVTDDMPFLVDSVEHGAQPPGPADPPHHPPGDPGPARRRRHARGGAGCGRPATAAKPRFESFMHFEVDRQSDPERLEAIRAELERVARRRARGGRGLAADARQGRRRARRPEARRQGDRRRRAGRRREAFLRWIADNHFTFLGYGCYDLIRDQRRRSAAPRRGLGARPAAPPADRRARPRAASPRLPPELRRQARAPVPLVITKANTRSTVHRPVYLDYIGVNASTPRARWSASTASSACSPRPPTTATRATSRCCATRSSG